MAELKFNASEVTPDTGFEPIPPGRYNVIITNSEIKDTKSGNGSYLKLTFQVQHETYHGRLIWSNLNLDNPNPKAVEIAQRELSALCRACGLDVIDDSMELHGIMISGQVKIRPAQGEWAAQNEISGFKAAVADTEESAPWMT